MLHPIPLAETRQVTESMGLDQHLRWCPERAPSSRNAMILTDPLLEERVDPYATIAADLKSGGTESLSLRMAYHVGRVYWARRQDPDVDALMRFLRKTLAAKRGHGLLVQSIGDDSGPEPWVLPNETESLAREPKMSELFARVGLTPGDARPLRCELQEDADDIELIGRWSMSSGWRNTYLLVDDLKILMCHEQDLHFCSTSATTVESIVTLARSEGLVVAPFDIEHCA